MLHINMNIKKKPKKLEGEDIMMTYLFERKKHSNLHSLVGHEFITSIVLNSHFTNEANENDVRTMLSQFDDLVWEVRCEAK